MRALRWKLKHYWRKAFVRDGVYRGNPRDYSSLVPGIRFYYMGESGEPDSATPVAYERLYE